ncbi:MAG TPA: hypothetical protein PKE43_14650, partial [Anaerolineales bacterium]|nr:hypothetical protein [Anaerolineales bacterium]
MKKRFALPETCPCFNPHFLPEKKQAGRSTLQPNLKPETHNLLQQPKLLPRLADDIHCAFDLAWFMRRSD